MQASCVRRLCLKKEKKKTERTLICPNKWHSVCCFHMTESRTHVESDSDDVQRHGGVSDAAEG